MKNPGSSDIELRHMLKETPSIFIANVLPVERYFSRPIAAVIVRLIYNTKITPNQVTVISFLIGILAAIFFLHGTPTSFLIGGILVQLSGIFDCADGMLARARNVTSYYGAYLDLFFDRMLDFIWFVSIVVGYYMYSGDDILLVGGLFGAGVFFLMETLYYLMRNYKGLKRTGETAELRGILIFAIMILGILNRLDIGIYALMILPPIAVLVIMIIFLSWWKSEDNKDVETMDSHD